MSGTIAPTTTESPPLDEQPVERAVKFVAPDTIEGLAFPFTTDTDDERFTKHTDLCLDWFPQRPLLYHHGLDKAHAAVKVGTVPGSDFEERESGIWAQSQLDANAKYRKRIDELIEQGALGYSSGAYPHLASKSRTGDITRWPWVELSLTPVPAHPGTLGVHYIKSIDILDLFEDIPPTVKAALAALDEWADSRGSDGSPDTATLEEKAGRVTAAVTDLRDHTRAYAEMRAKAGRVLSAQTRERLMRHPSSLRELADDLEGLLSEADAEKVGKTSALLSEWLATQERLARFDGVLERNPS